MVIARRCRRLIILVSVRVRFEHLDRCKTQRVESFLSVAGPMLDPPLRTVEGGGLPLLLLFRSLSAARSRGFHVMRNGKRVNHFYYQEWQALWVRGIK